MEDPTVAFNQTVHPSSLHADCPAIGISDGSFPFLCGSVDCRGTFLTLAGARRYLAPAKRELGLAPHPVITGFQSRKGHSRPLTPPNTAFPPVDTASSVASGGDLHAEVIPDNLCPASSCSPVINHHPNLQPSNLTSLCVSSPLDSSLFNELASRKLLPFEPVCRSSHQVLQATPQAQAPV
jgi:hypothetical protein